ncbi:DUF4942 domain-containing protein [Enterococcus ureasiticus]|uniref:DUF4942 domain-containing protein n=1 Tax=Enterococcus ureasiticus TaxID=903984 RepID=UPI001A8E6073|nr:DUF4942 domain-containing protein [Enterococcus ureasiticus]MBO0474859.1 DUF4942 domain-containing protein [Enterococcus ureasiticus]
MLKNRLKREQYQDSNPAFHLLCSDAQFLNQSDIKILIPNAQDEKLTNSSMKYHYGTKKQYSLLEKDINKSNALEQQGFDVIGTDFTSFTTHIEFDLILLNPPLDQGETYLKKAVELAQKQVDKDCFISALIKAEFVKNPSGFMHFLLEKNEMNLTFHENIFPDTTAELALIQLSVPKVTDNIHETYDNLLASRGFKPAQTSLERGLSTIVSDKDLEERLKDIRFLIAAYNEHISLLKKKYLFDNSLEAFETILRTRHNVSVHIYRRNEYTLNQEIKHIRSGYWEKILKTDEFRKKLTQHGSKRITDMVESSTKLEITEENVLLLLTALMSNGYEVVLDSCVEWFKKMTGNHQNEYSKNIHYYTGFKTNDAFKVNKKIIIPAGQAMSYYETMRFGYNQPLEESFDHLPFGIQAYIKDLLTMFQLINPTISNDLTAIHYDELENDFFRFKVFKKGTIHIWFKDLETLEQFNFLCGKKFGWVPSTEEIKKDPAALTFTKKEFPHLQNLVSK